MKKNKVVFISGSSSGLGFELAKFFSKENYIVVMNGRNKKKLLNASKKIINSYPLVGDLSSQNNCKNFFLKIKKKFSKLDLILCNAGVGNFKKTDSNLMYAFENNFFNTVNTVKFLSPLLKVPFSNIICISSICGVENISGALEQ